MNTPTVRSTEPPASHISHPPFQARPAPPPPGRFAIGSPGSLRTFLSIVWIATFWSIQTFAAQFVAGETRPIAGYQLHRQGIVWWWTGSCATEFRWDGGIRFSELVGAPPWTVALGCDLDLAGVARDDLSIHYTIGSRSSVLRWPVTALTSTPPVITYSSPANAPAAPGPIAIFENRLYFTLWRLGELTVFSTDLAGNNRRTEYFGSGPKLSRFEPVRIGAPISSRVALLALDTQGNLHRIETGTFGPEAFTQLATRVQDFAVRNESFSRSIGGVPGVSFVTAAYVVQDLKRLLRIDADSAAATVVHEPGGAQQVVAVAADDTNLYVVEQGVVCPPNAFCYFNNWSLLRQARPPRNGNNTAPWIVFDSGPSGVADPAVHHLRSDGAWVYFVQNRDIYRSRTDAPPLQVDLEALGVEVVQSVQDLNGTVRLVAGKPTFARGYARAAVNSGTLRTLNTTAWLTGTLDGQPLPGPLRSLGTAQIDDTTNWRTLRSTEARSFNFELPESWVRPGVLRVELNVNADQGVLETGANPTANNRTVSPATTIVPGGSPCVVFVPLITRNQPVYSPQTDWAFDEIVRRATSLLPVEQLRVSFRPALASFDVAGSSKSFTELDLTTKAGWSTALNQLFLYAALERAPGGCRDTHFVGAIHGSINSPWGGLARTGNALLAVMYPRPIGDPLDNESPYGGQVLAHELGHNYGRAHVDCGNPAGPDPLYPYPPCWISNPPLDNANAFFGFDPLTHAAIAPDTTGDLMSYADSQWTSRYTWEALINAIPSAAANAGHSGHPGLHAPLLTPTLLVQGSVNRADNRVALNPIHSLPPGVLDPFWVAQQLEAAAATQSPWYVRLLHPGGFTEFKLPLHEDEDIASPESVFFLPVVPPEGTYQVQIVRDGDVRAEAFASPNAPVVRLEPPTVSPAGDQLAVRWTSSDADGDPLLFSLQFSPDAGTTWQSVRVLTPEPGAFLDASTLPGGDHVLCRVLATDGFNTTIAESTPFRLPRRAPTVLLSAPVNGTRIAFGRPIDLSALASDPEDGGLPPEGIRWTVSSATPGTALVRTGGKLTLEGLAPGTYTVSAEAADSDGQIGSTTRSFEVLPIDVPESATPPVIDGQGLDPVWKDAAVLPLTPGAGSDPLPVVRIVRTGTQVNLFASGLPYGTPASHAALEFRIDPDGSGGATASTLDRGFRIDELGFKTGLAGDGIRLVETGSSVPFRASVIRHGAGWNVELQIDGDPLWAQSIVRIACRLVGPTSGGFPRNLAAEVPDTWARARLGAPAPVLPNRAPVASAGAPQVRVVAGGETILLDASSSADPDGDPLAYAWARSGGPVVALDNASASLTRFLAPSVDAPTTVSFRLTISDGKGGTATADTTVTLVPASRPAPVAPAVGFFQKETGAWVGRLDWPGPAYERVHILASTNLIDWVVISTAAVDDQRQIRFRDVDAARFPRRFYRAVTAAPTQTTVFDDTFESGAKPAWNVSRTDTTPTGRRFLGQFGNETAELRLANLPAHDSLLLRVDVYVINTWDGSDPTWGPDVFRIRTADGVSVLDTTFSGFFPQAYPDDYGATTHPPGTGAAEEKVLGYYNPATGGGYDAVYRIERTIQHTGDTVTLRFEGANLQEIADESWGIDNVEVIARKQP